MASSLVSALKRKLTSILAIGAANDALEGDDNQDEEGADADDRPHKRRRLYCNDGDVVVVAAAEEEQQKNNRLVAAANSSSASSSFSYTPLLVRESFRGTSKSSNNSCKNSNNQQQQQPSSLLRLLPNDVLSHILSHVNTPADRFAIQTCCKTFCSLSNGESMLATLELGGDLYSYSPAVIMADDDDDGGEDDIVGRGDDDSDDESTSTSATTTSSAENEEGAVSGGAGGIILDSDTSVMACKKLIKYAVAGNEQAVYMIAMILCYCHENISEGLALLRLNAGTPEQQQQQQQQNHQNEDKKERDQQQQQHPLPTPNKKLHLPSIYALALILRDSRSIESSYYLSLATTQNYTPAWQEKLTASEMRAQFGDLDAESLSRYLDPPCLNKLLARHYVGCQRVRNYQTSHCWNPLCGRWAYKATTAREVDLGGNHDANHDAADDDDDGLNVGWAAAAGAARGGEGVAGRRMRRHQWIARMNQVLAAAAAGGDRDAIHDEAALQLRLRNAVLEPVNASDNNINNNHGGQQQQHPQVCHQREVFSIESLLAEVSAESTTNGKMADSSASSPSAAESSPLEKIRQALRNKPPSSGHGLKVSRMKMCSSCRRAKYCSKLCQVYDWRSNRHKMECQFL